MSTYAFDNAAVQAEGRFAALEAHYDAVTIARLAELGVGPGWTCLEVGAGGGSIGRWLGHRVEPDGRVLVTDLDPRWITADLPDDVEVAVHDIRTDPLDEAAYDLVHARLVLIHLPERRAVLDRLVTALRPGGLLVLDEFDLTFVPVLRAPDAASAALFEKVHQAMIDTLEARGLDPRWGTHAYAALHDAGLTAVGARSHAEAWPSGVPGLDLHRVNIEQISADLPARGVTEDDLTAFWALLRDPDFAVASYPMITTWGRRPS